jgi:hypothetical protein
MDSCRLFGYDSFQILQTSSSWKKKKKKKKIGDLLVFMDPDPQSPGLTSKMV